LNAFDHRFTQRTIKVIFDGALGSRGAGLLAPYSDKADTSGFLTQKPEELRPMFEEALRRGIQVETHAIGDRANRTNSRPLRAGVQSRATWRAEIQEPRWRVEHAQILSEQDLPRFRQARCHRFDATVACDQRFVFRAGAAWNGATRRRVRLE
jgi:predicted amidohydrolase YtcJ